MSRIYNSKTVNTINVTSNATPVSTSNNTTTATANNSINNHHSNLNPNNLTKLYVFNGNGNNSKENSSPSLITSSTSSSQSSSSSHSPNNYSLNKSNDIPTQAKSEETNKMSVELSNLITRLEKVTGRLETVANKSTNGHVAVNGTNGTTAAESFDDLPSIVAFDDLFKEKFLPFKQLSSTIGSDVQTIVDLVEKVFKLQRSFLIEAARSLQPGKDVLLKFFQQFSKSVEEVQTFREKNRTSQLFNHLSGISESIGAFGWIAIQPAPSPYVKEMSDAAQFYTNRVLKDYKEKDPNHSNWVKNWLQLLNELQAYVKQYHTTGVTWNSSRKSATFDPLRISISGSVTTASVSNGGAPLPPPPPPPINLAELMAANTINDTNTVRSAGPSADALFAEINKGGAITSHLKKVSDDQKTHKNPTLRAGAIVPATSATSATSVSNKSSNLSQQQKTPVFELADKKWKVEYQQNRNDLVIDQTDLKHTVYIYQCRECTITVKGKVNSILIDSCFKVALLFDDVLSTVEFINTKNAQMQVLGRVPTVAIEKTDGCQVYLSRKSLDTEIVSSKSSAMNILIPNENDDDFHEEPIPEQYKTVIKGQKLITTPTETA